MGGKRTVFLDDILYIESQSHKLQFKTRDESLSMYGRIDELESKLEDYLFLRCHQSFLVNMGHIEKIRNALPGGRTFSVKESMIAGT